MFTLASTIGLPILNGIGTGTLDYPSVGAVVGWLLLAALVGSCLGILREHKYEDARPVADSKPMGPPFRLHDDAHREAA